MNLNCREETFWSFLLETAQQRLLKKKHPSPPSALATRGPIQPTQLLEVISYQKSQFQTSLCQVMASFKLQSTRGGFPRAIPCRVNMLARADWYSKQCSRSLLSAHPVVNATRRFFLLLLSLIGFFVDIPNCILSNVLT